jgi:hypothetical protein
LKQAEEGLTAAVPWAGTGDGSTVMAGEGVTAAPWWAGRGPRQLRASRRGGDGGSVMAGEGATAAASWPSRKLRSGLG